MEEQFWQSRWREKKIAFHEALPNRLLESHFHRLDLNAGDSVFVPLCGKSVDLDWLLDQDQHVVGCEFNREAAEEVFERLGQVPNVTDLPELTLLSAGHLRIFVGDFFNLTKKLLGTIDAIYDRAALVALPPSIRNNYTSNLSILTESARQLVISYDYDQSQTEGPPFSVPKSEIERQYSEHYILEHLSNHPIEGPLALRCVGSENAVLLTPR